MIISKERWKEIKRELQRLQISYTTHYGDREEKVTDNCRNPIDKYIQINLIIPNYFDD